VKQDAISRKGEKKVGFVQIKNIPKTRFFLYTSVGMFAQDRPTILKAILEVS
jgi:hypothetical protein